MDLSTLKPSDNSRKKRRRVGRGPGSGNGKTCGRGHKGQKARAGYSRRLGFEGGQMPLNRRLPKRGFYRGGRFPMALVNLDTLERTFEDGAEVSLEDLVERGVIHPAKAGLKVLGRGEVTKKLTVRCHGVSESAKSKIEAAGGSVEVLPQIRRQAKTAQETAED